MSGARRAGNLAAPPDPVEAGGPPAAPLAADDLPRVLFVTAHAFNHTTGGGVTFSNLFRGWPKDRLATVHCDRDPVTDDVCEQYFRLGPDELRKWGPLERLARSSGATGAAGVPGEGGAAAAGGARTRAVRRLKRLVIGDYTPEQSELSDALARWIERFQPDVLYTILGSNGLMELIDRIRGRFRLPHVVHFMDDWPQAIYRGGLLSVVERHRMRRNLGRLVGEARATLAISPAMCDAYAARYGRPFRPFQNTVDVAALRRLAGAAAGGRAVARLVYAGNVLPFAQADALADCCRAVATLAAAGRPVRLDIFAPAAAIAAYRERFEVSDAVRMLPGLAGWEDYYRSLCDADLLLLPVNFDAASIRFIRYSMPTKVPEMLASGVPVLVYGPGETAQVDYAAREGWGRVVDAAGVDGLSAAIARLLDDGEARAGLVARALAVAEQHHDAGAVRAAFRRVLADAAAAGPPA